MKITPGNPRHLSIFIAVILALIVFAISLTVLELTTASKWIVALTLAFTTFIVVFISLLYTLNRFIYNKIRLIYKSIRSTKLGKSDKKIQMEKGDVLENVSRDVEQWTRDKANEIEVLKKNEEFRREFIGNVSHELKTPITTIQGYVLTLLDGGIHDDEINVKYLQRAAKNIDRLIAIVNDLDEIAKLESGTMKMNFSNFNFSALVKDVFEFMEIKAEKRRIVLDYKNQSDSKTLVHADPDRIRQVLINLIDNSLKYGNRFGSTTISAFDMDEYFLIEVADNGIGIDQADLPRIFERFYRTEKSRSRKLGGTGLGLAIVKHIIEAHQQTIHVRSKIDVGTTFSFTLAKATK
ncbi:MAG: sensor histidine kinase [Bacteroidales bacterium]|nr:ATP-binding protein [Bacteroidales bacterium]